MHTLLRLDDGIFEILSFTAVRLTFGGETAPRFLAGGGDRRGAKK